MFWIWTILVLLLFWLIKRHPTKSNFKIFDNYSYYISRYLDINKKDKLKKKDKGRDN
ncbi:hypothetical protein [Orenia marismortui]|uniref:Uncharacterized protein n=1 Tax=Orenia marismortui TaxID=46469 RepID=A0A4R8GYI6_9FIRM|nr:hypothetical protein [Orenia marismortui]TDX51541.1 hypothetical protein C7959_11241 [Orenia marismortui]